MVGYFLSNTSGIVQDASIRLNQKQKMAIDLLQPWWQAVAEQPGGFSPVAFQHHGRRRPPTPTPPPAGAGAAVRPLAPPPER